MKRAKEVNIIATRIGLDVGFRELKTQGQIKGARESLNGRKNIYGTKKSKER